MTTSSPNGTSLGLGADIVRELLPHRPPFLFVDGVNDFSSGQQPFLEASHYISPNEPAFAGHFPDLYLWPGVYTLEGLAQACLLLMALLDLQATWREANEPGDLAAALRAWQRSRSAPRGMPDHQVNRVMERLGGGAAFGQPRRGGMLVAVEAKLSNPVFAGQRLDYRVQRTHTIGSMVRLAVNAAVAGRSVARGTLTMATTTDGRLG